MIFKYKLNRELRLFSVATILLLATGYTYAHAGPLNKMAVFACSTKVKSAACKYEGGHSDLYKGTCQHMANNLICVRNQPIQKVNPEKLKAEDEQPHKHEIFIKE